jgi:hypothetical protein
MDGIPRDQLCSWNRSAKERADCMNAGFVPSPAPQNTQIVIDDEESIENKDDEDVIFIESNFDS